MRPDGADTSVPSAILDALEASDELDVAANVAKVRSSGPVAASCSYPPAKRQPGIERVRRLELVPSGRLVGVGGDDRIDEAVA
jgi:hypothetical protein